MSWIFIALLASLCWSITNHLEKIMLSRFFKSGDGAGGFILTTLFSYALVIPAIYFFKPSVAHVGLRDMLIMMASGIAYMLGILAYLHAIEHDEVSIAVPIFQTIPIFAYIFSYFLLGEQLTRNQIIGSAIIICAAIAITIEHSSVRTRVRAGVLGLMLLSSALISLDFPLFKIGALNVNYWTATFWQFIGSAFVLMLLFLFASSYRRSFVNVIRKNGFAILSFDFINCVIDFTGTRLMSYVVLFVPVALAQVVNGFQPVFVFLIGIAITIFAPHLGKEKITRGVIIQKSCAIAAMLVGAYIISIP